MARGLEEGLAHVRGEIRLRTRAIRVPDNVDVRAVREKCGLSQSQFANQYGFNPRTIRRTTSRAGPNPISACALFT